MKPKQHIVVTMLEPLALAAAGLLALGAPAAAQDRAYAAELEAIVEDAPTVPAPARLARLLDAHWEWTLREHPEFATRLGAPGDHGAWTDASPAAIERRRQGRQRTLSVLASIDAASLPAADRLNHDLFEREIADAVREDRFPGHLMPLDQMGGVQQSVASLFASAPRRSVGDYRHLLERLGRVASLVDQNIALLREGLEAGITPPRVTLRDVPGQVLAMLADEPLESPVLLPFASIPDAVPAAERDRIRGESVRIYRESVAPAFERLHRFLVEEYIPGARESIGLSELPGGSEWYRARARRYTTTELTPREIHDLGLAEVARIRSEMESIIARVGFEGGFESFLELLRTDPRFYFDSAEELIAAYRDIAKRADPELASLFGTLPRLPYGVRPVPSYAERSQTTAYYQRGSPELGRPGWYFVNTYALDTRPRYEMEALTLHEAMPGHHLQIALAQELDGLPPFRRFGGYTAFVEGWALYAESLGEEMGFYEDPYSKFGQLTYEMWRAVRLVVDTGMHELGWSRQRAIDYFREHAGKSEHDITVEIDRYIVWPGQALAYKMGELRIKEMRALATRELGERFDVRAFHDVVLGAGAVPLDVLEERVRAWISERDVL